MYVLDKLDEHLNGLVIMDDISKQDKQDILEDATNYIAKEASPEGDAYYYDGRDYFTGKYIRLSF